MILLGDTHSSFFHNCTLNIISCNTCAQIRGLNKIKYIIVFVYGTMNTYNTGLATCKKKFHQAC